MGTFIADGATVLPDVKSDARAPTGAVTEWAAQDANEVRTALLDLRTNDFAVETLAATAEQDAQNAIAAIAALRVEFAAGTGAFDNSGIAFLEQFGAVGDGITDDTVAIQTALNTLTARVMGSAGATYLVTKQGEMSLFSNVPLVKTSYCLKIPSGVVLDLGGSTLKLGDDENAAIAINENATGSYGYAEGLGYTDHDLGVENGTLDGNQANQTYEGGALLGEIPCVYFVGVLRPRAYRLKVVNGRRYAGRFLNCDHGFFDDLYAEGCRGDSWSFGTSGASPTELRYSQIGSVSADNCTAETWYQNPQGNGAIFTTKFCEVGQVISKNCGGGIKIQSTTQDTTFGSLIFVGGANGTLNSGVKVQGDGTGALTPERVAIGKIISRDTVGAGLYLHDTGLLHIGSYEGYGNATDLSYPDVWIDSSECVIGSIISDAAFMAPVLLRAEIATKPVYIGAILGRNMDAAVTYVAASGAGVLVEIGHIAADVTSLPSVFQYNDGTGVVRIGTISKGAATAEYSLAAAPTTGSFTLLTEGATAYASLNFSAAAGIDAITFLNNGARLRLGDGDAYLYSGDGDVIQTPAVLYAEGIQKGDDSEMVVAGNISDAADAVALRFYNNREALATPGAMLATFENPGNTPVFSLDHLGNAVMNGAWDSSHLILGTHHVWVGAGKLYIKDGAPANATDGTVVGAQS